MICSIGRLQYDTNHNNDSDTETADCKMTPLEYSRMLKATSEQLNDQNLDAALAAPWSPTGSGSSPAAKRARVELETAEVGGKKARATYTTSGNADSDSDSDEFEQEEEEDARSNKSEEIGEFIQEADDADDDSNGSDESDDSDEFEWQTQGTNSFQVQQYCQNKDEVQHDEQEEEQNHGHTNTRTENRTRVQPKTFEQHIEQLKAFKEAHGHLRVTRSLDKNLASFCRAKRQARRKPTSTGKSITEEKIKALDELGFEWNVQKQLANVQTRSFEQRIEQLKSFQEAHGHPHVTVTLDKNLALLCCRMRQAHRKPESK